MPSKSLRPCWKCGKAAPNAQCSEHPRPRYDPYMDRQRGTANERGYDSRWQKARINFLRSNPLCAECLRNNMYVQAVLVDHIIPHKGDMDLFWDHNNWQPLCRRCHDVKTADEKK